MNRLICLYYPGQPQTADGFEPLSLDQLSQLVNYSVGHIYCPILELYTKIEVEQILPSILQKIRPQGLMTLKIANIPLVCRDYYMGSMTDDTLTSFILNKNSILSQPYIETIIDKSKDFKLVKIESSDRLTTYITAQRTSV